MKIDLRKVNRNTKEPSNRFNQKPAAWWQSPALSVPAPSVNPLFRLAHRARLDFAAAGSRRISR